MRKLFCLLAALWSFEATATDLPVKAKAPAAPLSAFYVNGNVVGGTMKTNVAFLTIPGVTNSNLHPTGIGFGGGVGFRNWLPGGQFLDIGANVDWMNDESGVTQCLLVQQCTTKASWQGDLLIRFGAPMAVVSGQVARLPQAVASPSQWPIPITLPANGWGASVAPYIGGGVGIRDIKACVQGPIDNQGCQHEWVIGPRAVAGLLMPVSHGVSLGIEAIYTNWNKTFAPTAPTGPMIFDGTFHASSEWAGRLYLSLQFGG